MFTITSWCSANVIENLDYTFESLWFCQKIFKPTSVSIGSRNYSMEQSMLLRKNVWNEIGPIVMTGFFHCAL